jgi:1-acyl-sn-glycerol-3-phosphate acyltransferase
MEHLFIFRIIVLIILYIIFYIGYVYCGLGNWWIKYTTTYFLKVANIRNVKINGEDKIQKLYESDKKFIVVLNHRTVFDMWITVMANPNICILTSLAGAKIVPGMYALNKKINSIIFDSTIKGQKITDLIYERISNRKPKDNMLVIYPDAMEPIPAGKNIAPFKTGAFRGKFDILPVVIKYKNWTIDPTLHWYKGEHPVICFSKVLLDGKCEVVTDVMDLVSCKENMTVEEYRDYVYNLMDTRYNQL